MGRPRASWGFVLALVFSLAIGARSSSRDSQVANAAISRLIDAYERGAIGAVTFDSSGALSQALKSTGRAWADAGPAEDRPRRRNLLALIVLDYAISAEPQNWNDTTRLIEWACDYLRSAGASPFEREWMVASMAVGELRGDEPFLLDGSCTPPAACNHVRHALSRFPDDPLVRAGQVFGRLEVNKLTRRPVNSVFNLLHSNVMGLTLPTGASREFTPTDADRKRQAETFKLFDGLVGDSDVGLQARLRRGILHYELRELAASRQDLTAVTGASTDPFLVYLAHLVTGLGFDAEARPADAVRAYAAAVHVEPAIHSGAEELAAHYFQMDRRAEASELLDFAFAVRQHPPDDPWQYSCAHCAGWSSRLAALRAMVRR